MKRQTSIFIGVALVVIVAIITVIFGGGQKHSTDTAATLQDQDATTAYTLKDVAMHQSATDCWVAIDGSVYNLTDWVSKHPGGPDKIIKLCGKDGSAIFNGQHGGQPQPEAALAMFKIGTLSN